MSSVYTREHIIFIIKTVHCIQRAQKPLSENLARLVNEKFPTLNSSFEALYKVYKKHKNSKVCLTFHVGLLPNNRSFDIFFLN